MAIPLKEIIENPEKLDELKIKSLGLQQVERILARYERAPDKPRDMDRYYEEWGSLVEKHPIVSPRHK